MSKKKECEIRVSIHLRGTEETDPRYCVEAQCDIHHSIWMGLTNDKEQANNMAHSFPLVCGGMSHGLEAFPVPMDCQIRSIPRKQP